MRSTFMLAAVLAALPLSQAQAETTIVCTTVADVATGHMLVEEGACDTRAPAASTFKIPISLMGFDSGFMKDAHAPTLPFEEGYADWIEAWRQPSDPERWMRESVVWYSHLITQSLGAERFAGYVRDFGYGNEDVSGDPGQDNGLTRSWLSSSLEISPSEQLDFLRRLVKRELPVSAHAYEMTQALVDHGVQPGGWHVYGKTGAALSKNPDGTVAQGQPWGWFVGWAEREGRTIVFARLTKDTQAPARSPGRAARDALLDELFAGPSEF